MQAEIADPKEIERIVARTSSPDRGSGFMRRRLSCNAS
jgi:hypothetical protein